jgi:hypothetical protein
LRYFFYRCWWESWYWGWSSWQLEILRWEMRRRIFRASKVLMIFDVQMYFWYHLVWWLRWHNRRESRVWFQLNKIFLVWCWTG